MGVPCAGFTNASLGASLDAHAHLELVLGNLGTRKQFWEIWEPGNSFEMRAQTSILTMENHNFLVQVAPQTSWPPSLSAD